MKRLFGTSCRGHGIVALDVAQRHIATELQQGDQHLAEMLSAVVSIHGTFITNSSLIHH